MLEKLGQLGYHCGTLAVAGTGLGLGLLNQLGQLCGARARVAGRSRSGNGLCLLQQRLKLGLLLRRGLRR
ncbi:MAG TPA: hypothetical protein VKU60_14070 [Chloroflexota bacterium]|nr:hypothetical protein [Chloroflexota bacterium]